MVYSFSISLSLSISLHSLALICRFVLACMHALVYTFSCLFACFIFFLFLSCCSCSYCHCPSVFVYFCVSYPPISMSCYHVDVDAADSIKVFFFYYYYILLGRLLMELGVLGHFFPIYLSLANFILL